MSHLPFLKAIQAFEVSGRNLSFKDAAEELGVTPAAISHHIKTLEEYIGQSLFVRKSRQVHLTKLGQELLPKINKGFDIIEKAIHKTKADKKRKILHINTSPSFAGKWLLPRLNNFQLCVPEIDIALSTTVTPIDLKNSDDHHIAIRYGRGDDLGLFVEKIMDESLYPVCTPEYMDKHKIKKPEDVLHCTLIHDTGYKHIFPDYPGWIDWAEKMNVSYETSQRSSSFELSNFTIQAALEGQGIALGRSRLVADDLKSGKLVRPFDDEILLPFSYHIVTLKDSIDCPWIQKFREWITVQCNPECHIAHKLA